MPLGKRLDAIEDSITDLNGRVNKIFIMLATLVGIANAPGFLDALNKVLGH